MGSSLCFEWRKATGKAMLHMLCCRLCNGDIKEDTMKKGLSAAVLLSVVALAGCQTNTPTVIQITGPASAPTGVMAAGTVPIAVAEPTIAASAPAQASAPAPAPTAAPVRVAAVADTCGAAAYQALVDGPSSAVFGLPIPGSSRHYGSDERTATDTPSRLNFVHSGTAVDAVVDPASTVQRVFCG